MILTETTRQSTSRATSLRQRDDFDGAVESAGTRLEQDGEMLDAGVEGYDWVDVRQAVIPDYKIYYFHWQPQAILVMRDREKETKEELFDVDWVKLDASREYQHPNEQSVPPECLHEMLEAAKKSVNPSRLLAVISMS